MSNETKVPSAIKSNEERLNIVLNIIHDRFPYAISMAMLYDKIDIKKLISGFVLPIMDESNSDYARLHCEAMAKEIAEKAKLEEESLNTMVSAYSVDKKSIMDAATNYISKIKQP